MTNIRVAFALGVLLLAGCARATGPRTTPVEEPAYSDDALVLRISYSGGLAPQATSVIQLPPLSVYGDGRVVTEGPTTLEYPGPALPNVQVQHIAKTDAARLVRLAVDAGVGSGTDLGVPHVIDAPATRFTVLTEGGVRTTQVDALREAGDDTGLSAEQRAARAKLVHLLEQLTDLPKTLGPGAIDQAKPFKPAALAAVVREYQPGDQPQPDANWVGPALPGEPLNGATGLGCVTATGDDLAKLLTAAEHANGETRWMSGGKPWSVKFRPVLPDETGCADLGKH